MQPVAAEKGWNTAVRKADCISSTNVATRSVFPCHLEGSSYPATSTAGVPADAMTVGSPATGLPAEFSHAVSARAPPVVTLRNRLRERRVEGEDRQKWVDVISLSNVKSIAMSAN